MPASSKVPWLPPSWCARIGMRVIWGFAFLVLFSTAGARAATPRPASSDVFITPDPGAGTVPVTGLWRFSTGDNLAWASPSFDDSAWEKIRGDDTWGSQTHPAYTGYAWYRRSIDITNSTEPLAIAMPMVDDAYELYFNGQKIGAYGKLPPGAWWWAPPHSEVFALPASKGVIAVRVWKSLLSSIDPPTLGGFNFAPTIGRPQLLVEQIQGRRFRREHQSLPRLLTSAVLLVSGLIALFLFLRQRTEWLFLWLSLFLIADAYNGFTNLDPLRNGQTFALQQLFIQIQNSVSDISLWLILLSLFGLANLPRWRRWTIILASLYLSAQAIDITAIFLWGHGGAALPWVDAVTTTVYSLTPLFIFVITAVGLARRGRRSLWPLATAVFLYGTWNVVTAIASQGIRFTHWTLTNHLGSLHFVISGYQFDARFILDTILFLALLATVAHHHFLDRRRQTQIDMELKSAREVQQVLMPEATPAVPGFTIGNIYRPASEVGGDFFQVVSLAGGDALVVIGDVSGKGLTAAMTVSLIVGALRTLAEFTSSPAEVLRHLNRRLHGRMHDGFATCLAMRLAPDGKATIANAGHLPPISNQRDLAIEGSLPLGVVENPEYADVALQIREGETLTLYTDGVVEAQNAQGQLFGFERVQQMLRSGASVELLVSEASAFGQQDDLTVLSICRETRGQQAPAADLTADTTPAIA